MGSQREIESDSNYILGKLEDLREDIMNLRIEFDRYSGRARQMLLEAGKS
jgi:hypothetical protein